MGWMNNETGLERRTANHVPLTPLSHLRRAAELFGDREALIYGAFRLTYSEYHARVSRLASALENAGISAGDVVAALLPNIPAHAEAHFGVPACGAVLNSINTRLDADTVAYIFDHGEARIVLADTSLLPVVEDAIARMEGPSPRVIEVCDRDAGFTPTGRYQEYEAFLEGGDPEYSWVMPEDEWESLTLNYTSGTTGRPKGVVYHHRGAYLMTMGTLVSWQMTRYPRYLTIVPMFHCNGWNHIWMLPLVAGAVVCCRQPSASEVNRLIDEEGVTHFGGAPILLNMLANAPEEERRTSQHIVQVFTAGAPPPAATLAAVEPLGFNVMQVYGLTETYGHVTESLWREDLWGAEDDERRFRRKARAGVRLPMMEEVEVLAEGGRAVEWDDTDTGEIMHRGNTVMKGYYKDPDASEAAFAGGYFHSGDLAVRDAEGYIRIVDRAKDIIISGGENVSSVSVEDVIARHHSVSLCAVVAKPDEKWGEVPCAFIELKSGHNATEAEIIGFCRTHLAGFMAPKKVVFGELPKTATGKIQKFELRQAAKAL
ncbi:MAG: AMP-binding protein [Marivivens sp.]|nr:AMP-binding protein [Marivivens sp.]